MKRCLKSFFSDLILKFRMLQKTFDKIGINSVANTRTASRVSDKDELASLKTISFDIDYDGKITKNSKLRRLTSLLLEEVENLKVWSRDRPLYTLKLARKSRSTVL